MKSIFGMLLVAIYILSLIADTVYVVQFWGWIAWWFLFTVCCLARYKYDE